MLSKTVTCVSLFSLALSMHAAEASVNACAEVFKATANRLVIRKDPIPRNTVLTPLMPKIVSLKLEEANFKVIGQDTLAFRFDSTSASQIEDQLVQSFRVENRRVVYLSSGKIGTIVSVRDVDGSIYRFELEGDRTYAQTLKLKVAKAVALSAQPELPENHRQTLRKKFQEFSTKAGSAHEIAELLTGLHLATSTNFQFKADFAQTLHAIQTNQTKNQEFADGLYQANSLLANLLIKDADLTETYLSRINLLVNRGTTVHSDVSLNYLAGLLRGTRHRDIDFRGEKIDVDLVDSQVAQGTKLVNWFAPGREVPGLLSSLLLRINSISMETSLTDIFLIYRNFIQIHPYIDGNGRTGRCLLNFMLLKAGFPPMVRPSESLYYSEHELAHAYFVSQSSP